MTYPIWTGCFWADGEISPATDAAPEVKFWKTDAVFVRIDGAAGEIVFETQGGAKLTISATEIKAEASTVAQGVGPPLSGITLGIYNDTTHNQGTDCFVEVGLHATHRHHQLFGRNLGGARRQPIWRRSRYA